MFLGKLCNNDNKISFFDFDIDKIDNNKVLYFHTCQNNIVSERWQAL